MSWRLSVHEIEGAWELSASQEAAVCAAISEISDTRSGPALSISALKEMIREAAAQYTRKMQISALGERAHSSRADQERHLGARLGAVVNLCPPEWALIDIGTDHARLPAAALKGGSVSVAAGIDIARAPLKAASARVERAQLRGSLALILGDGIAPLSSRDGASSPLTGPAWISAWDETHQRAWLTKRHAGEVVVTICGVGGWLAAEKVRELPSWVSAVIVQPNNGFDEVERALTDFVGSSGQLHQSRGSVSEVSVSPTLTRDRLFITSMAWRAHARPHQPSRREDHMWSLWCWVKLSRSAQVVSKTPAQHPSYDEKQRTLERSILMWCT